MRRLIGELLFALGVVLYVGGTFVVGLAFLLSKSSSLPNSGVHGL